MSQVRQLEWKKDRHIDYPSRVLARTSHLFFSDDNKGASFTNNEMNFSCYSCNHSRNGMFRRDEWKSLDASQKRVCAYLCKWLSTKLKVWALKVGRSVSRLLTLHMGRLLVFQRRLGCYIVNYMVRVRFQCVRLSILVLKSFHTNVCVKIIPFMNYTDN